MMARCAVFLLLCLCGLPWRGLANPTNLINVPIAAIQDPGAFTVQWQQGLTNLTGDQALTGSLLSEFGVTSRVEAGCDWNNFGAGDQVEVDAKYQWRDPATHPWGAAVGLYNIGRRVQTFYYGVVSVMPPSPKAIDVHAGIGTDGTWHGLLGLTVPVNDRWIIYTDWITGTGGAFAIEPQYQFAPSWALSLIYQRNQGQDSRQLFLQLAYSGSVH